MKTEMRISVRRLAAFAAGWLALAATASATSVVPMSVEELARGAATVVEARAMQNWSQWDEREHLIYTFTRFQVSRALKGQAPQTLVVRQMGGSAGGYSQHVAGVRHWSAGEEAVLFLRPSVARDGTMAVVGLMQGNFIVQRSPQGEATVSNGVPEVSALGAAGTMQTFSGSRMRLSDLERRVGKAQP